MKETFRERLAKSLGEMVETPPTMEGLSANFPHKENCSRVLPLRRVEKEEVEFLPGSGWAGMPTIRAVKSYLECDQCHVQERFVE